MTGAMYAAVSGLKAHMSALNVIGNNVANVNTNAYKASRFTFLESLYTSVSGGSDGSVQAGGKNPAQIGYGCSLGTIDLDMSTKNYSPTGKEMDCMIDGDGFFLVGSKDVDVSSADKLTNLKLTRLGNLGFDSQGYLVDGQGQVVYGFLRVQGEAAGDEDNGLRDSTILAPIRLPMAASGTENDVKKGTPLYPTVADGQIVDAGLNDDGTTDATVDGRVVLDSVGINEKTGRITGTTADGTTVVVGYIALGKVDNPNGVTHVDGHYYQALDGSGQLHLASLGGELVKDEEGDGADADAADIEGNIPIMSAGETKLIAGGLESSGTDLASEITSMITVQRGYQANTRIVTVTDTMLEELVNMKR